MQRLTPVPPHDPAREQHNTSLAIQRNLSSSSGQLRDASDAFQEHFSSCIAVLKRLHASDLAFQGILHPEYAVMLQFGALERFGARSPELRAGELLFNDIVKAKPSFEMQSVPCHGQCAPSRFFYCDSSVWLSDWSWSAMSTPYWDLASLSNEASQSLDADWNMLRAHQADSGTLAPLLYYKCLHRLFQAAQNAVSFAVPEAAADILPWLEELR